MGLGALLLALSLFVIYRIKTEIPKDPQLAKDRRELALKSATTGITATLVGGTGLALSILAIKNSILAVQGLNYIGVVSIALLIIATLAMGLLVKQIRSTPIPQLQKPQPVPPDNLSESLSISVSASASSSTESVVNPDFSDS